MGVDVCEEARDREAASADEEEAAAALDEEDATESSTVVWTAVKTD